MAKALNFQQVILKLHEFWAAQGCAIWEPYNVQVGAGTGNPATLLRVLGPEPWRVAYVEPSVRPDDGRYGDNPNRMQKYYQYQVILKPDPGNPQELYLQSLEALGINPREHDIRFVEDNWESPALGAWGLGWEVWLDGQEITQFTYFQQAAGMELNPVAVEITYGVERIVLALQNRESAWQIEWLGDLSYADMMFQEEVEHCRYYFDIADVDALRQVYATYEREVASALRGGAIISAYDYVLKCSHLFNVLDTRGAIGVTERAAFFRRMRDMTRDVARAYVAKREALGYPLLKMGSVWGVTLPVFQPQPVVTPPQGADFLLELGVEELPAADVDAATPQLQGLMAGLLEDLRLDYGDFDVFATPRRLVVLVKDLAPRQRDQEYVAKGPPAERAFDKDGKPTQAAIGFARGKGVDVGELRVEEMDGGRYVVALVREAGKPSAEVLAEAMPKLLSDVKFGKSMRWNESGVAFSRPLRWIVALLGDQVVPFSYAGVISGRETRGLRPHGSPLISLARAEDYLEVMQANSILVDQEARLASIRQQVHDLALEVGGEVPEDLDLLLEVVNLVESPTALRGTFDAKYLELPRDVLVTVMRDKQRYFPVQDSQGQLMPYFITVRNGDAEHLDKVIHGNEHVLRARFSDADYFFRQDVKKPLADYLPRLKTLTFQEKLGSMYDKNQRLVRLVDLLAAPLGLAGEALDVARQAAALAKADLATQMVVEMTSLQGTMGREYALREGQPASVAQAIAEHWQPRGAGDSVPHSAGGVLLALADKLDSLVGLFAVGLAPKATSDPYGLRRAALGVLQILIRHQIAVDVRELLALAAQVQPVPVDEGTLANLAEFMRGRLDALLAEETSYPRDVMNAVLAAQGFNPYRAYVGAGELHQWTQRDSWEALLDNFARCVRITRSESQRYPLDESRLQEPAERALLDGLRQAQTALRPQDNVGAFLDSFAPLVPLIRAFFDSVMVNVDDQAVRQARLALLQAISALSEGRADLSQMSGF
ncbi:MAG: glycine--tRNA ligase subunit beta [Anaerolineae bacterium]|nr:glycine--tRNA ligase subunit beta [Anaerolineae bacterium]MDW8171231.1 glycine--tRNA ligase subunit beta [Anaerolineae bacterium]